MKTIRIGITGGIGSGKSVVSRLLGVMGVPVYISDDEAKRITLTDADVRCRLTALVGSDLYSGSSMRKELLANYLFASPQNAARVNAIIHPAVKADFLRWVAAHASCPIVGIESAILIEAGFTDVVDRVVMVCAPYDVRVERAMQRDGAQRSAVERRVRAQMDDEAKLSHAHYVINNGPDSELMPQAKHLIESLKAENLK
jgi:dephospho-CoA kinase